MYHLTRYKYWFFLISGLVIVPGLLALIFWHLNLGIDFTNGATINMRFANNGVTTTEVASAFKKVGAQDVTVFAGTSAGQGTIPTDQYFYITFSRPIGKAEVTNVQNLLGITANNVDNVIYTYDVPNAANPGALMVVHFDKQTTAAAVEAKLAKLPPTDAPPVETAPSPTTQATAKATGTVSATATAKATATTAATTVATGTPSSAVATPAPTAQSFPVKVTKVTQGANGQTYEVNTQTFLTNTQLNTVVFALNNQYGPAYVQDQQSVGPSIAAQTTLYAFLAVLLASLAILIYIGIAFRKVGSLQRSFRFGASAIIALLHDALVVVGLWAIFGHFFNFKVDSLFLTAVLTVIGFSVHDTIVVFDRIRENLSRRTSESFQTVVDTSLIQTMSRSLNTSLTVLFTLAALTLFGGASVQQFTLALLIGIASGTYSSIFNASMILVVWETGEYKQWFGRRPTPPAVQGRGGSRRRELVGANV